MAKNDNVPLLLFLLAIGTGITVAIITGGTSAPGTLAYISNYKGADQAAFEAAVINMASELGISANDIMFVMDNESDHTFSPSIKGPGTNPPIGLIQFEPDTTVSLGTSTAALAQMTAIQQLQYVQKYLQNVISQYGNLDNTTDVYMAVLYPPAIGAGPDYQFPTDVINDNPEFFKGTSGSMQDFINWITNTIGQSDLFPNIT